MGSKKNMTVWSAGRRSVMLAALAGALLCAAQAPAQSFNVDIGGATGVANAPPWPCFEAVGRPGTWNNWNSTTTALNNLVKTDGSVSTVNLTRSSGVGGTFSSSLNSGNSGHWFRLLNDAQDVGGAGASRTYTFTGLAAGTYDVYTYAVAPDSTDFRTNVSVTLSADPVQVVGGAMPGDASVLGMTHAHHVVILDPGDPLVIVVSTHTSFGSINGIQIVHDGEPSASPLCAEGSVSPSNVEAGQSTVLTVVVTPGLVPPSTDIMVHGDLSAIGGSSSAAFTDMGADVFTLMANVPPAQPGGTYNLTFLASDAEGRTASGVVVLGVTPALPPSDFVELEPNDTKALATLVDGISAGQTIAGYSTGASTTVPGNASADTYLIKTASLPLGIYRHRLVISTSGAAGHTGTIRGLSQVASPADTMPGIPWDGVIGSPGTADNTAQTSSTLTTPPRMNQWYGFGQEEQLYYRVAGTASTTAPYLVTMETSPVSAVDIGSFEPGLITLNFTGQGHTTDTSVWVYDSELNAIPGYGNEDANAALGGAPIATTSLQSWLAREYAPGTYYIAVSNFRMANNQPAASDDNFRTGTILDFPDAVYNSSTATGNNLTFTIADSAGNSMQVANTKPEAYGINFFKFDVESPCAFADLTCDGVVNVFDLLALLAAWGNCVDCGDCSADLNVDCTVNVFDLLLLLANWG